MCCSESGNVTQAMPSACPAHGLADAASGDTPTLYHGVWVLGSCACQLDSTARPPAPHSTSRGGHSMARPRGSGLRRGHANSHGRHMQTEFLKTFRKTHTMRKLYKMFFTQQNELLVSFPQNLLEVPLHVQERL